MGDMRPVQVMETDEAANLEFQYSGYEEEHFYYTKCMYRGYALIISNEEKFTCNRSHGKVRIGSAYDREGFVAALRKLNFLPHHIRLERNRSAEEIKRVLQEVARMDFTDYSCLIVAVFSFGEPFKVYGLDEKLTYNQLISPFRQAVAPTLFDKPKIFIVQTEPTENYALEPDYSGGAIPPALATDVITEPDLMFIYSHDVEELIWRADRRGSWFIQSLCEVLRLDGKRVDIMNVMTRVNFLVHRYYESYVAGSASKAYCPKIVSLLTKKLQLW